MRTVFTEKHKLRDAKTELVGGELIAPFEAPIRAEHIISRVREVNLGEVLTPTQHPIGPIARVHDGDYLQFLETVWDEWIAAGFTGEVLPVCWPSRAMTRNTPPRFIEGRIGYYCLAGETSISNGTWEAARASADVALTAQALVAGGERAAFALCRPPGHHAATDMYGGYCFINNAAVAAQAFLDGGATRVAILDIDFHHGNGTQEIFYKRDDVLFLSLHGDPMDAFPHYLGGADEIGLGAGEGYNVNLTFSRETGFDTWFAGLEEACRRIDAYGPDVVVISHGVDTFKGDPISFFRLESVDFLKIGERIAQLGRPTLFVMEGGYAVAEIGVNAVNVLEGFEGRGA